MSEKSETRFSTPVSDLDDHRFQPSSLPRADTMPGVHHASGNRRQTSRSQAGDELPSSHVDMLRVDAALRNGLPEPRDWEHAVVEEESDRDASAREVDGHTEERTSSSPLAPRRGPLKYSEQPEKQSRSRPASVSSSSSSPPNSVDAFADPRRRERAGTLGSKAPSDLELALGRTASRGTSFRRPTFSEGNVNKCDSMNDVASKHGSAEEDVCFPPFGETSKTYSIDFECLEEFVAEHARGHSPVAGTNRAHNINDRHHQPRVFDDLRPKRSTIVPAPARVPKIGVQEASPTPPNLGGPATEDEILKEKISELDRPVPKGRSGQAEPNRFSFFSSELDSTIHAAEIGDLVMPGDSFRDLFELDPEGGVWWLDVLNPTEEEIMVLTKAFSIHPLTSEDIKTQETREKVELFKQYYFVCFRSFYQMEKTSEEYMDPVNIYIVVFREGVISFTFRSSPHAANVRGRISKLRDYVALSSDWICYAMMWVPSFDDDGLIVTVRLTTEQRQYRRFIPTRHQGYRERD